MYVKYTGRFAVFEVIDNESSTMSYHSIAKLLVWTCIVDNSTVEAIVQMRPALANRRGVGLQEFG